MGRASRAKRERRDGRDQRRRDTLHRARIGEARGCLFCRRSDGGFLTQEHVFPESIGNTKLVLENGVVCDRCNNETLSSLDQAICDFFPVKMRRTMLGIPSKAGVVPTTRVSTGTVESVGPASLRFNSNTGAPMLREMERQGATVRLEMSLSGGRRMTPRYGSELSRALLKSALECAWLDHGELILKPRFDHVRSAVQGARRDGFLAMARQGDPTRADVSLTYDLVSDRAGNWRIWVIAQYFGVVLATDSHLAAPVGDLPSDAISVVRFTAADFRAA